MKLFVYQSSQVHPVFGCQGTILDPDWSCLFGQWTGMCRCGLTMDRLRRHAFPVPHPTSRSTLASPVWQRPRRRGWS
jgi:hypothetical protein